MATMTEERKERLKAAGFSATTVSEFLGLTPEDEAYIEMRRVLAHALRERRKQAGLTQAQLAARIGSGQARIARAEAGDGSVSFDLLIRALLATGATHRDVGRALCG